MQIYGGQSLDNVPATEKIKIVIRIEALVKLDDTEWARRIDQQKINQIWKC